MNPKFTIIIPTLQEGGQIAATAHAARAEFSDDEIIVVDGGSTDTTLSAAACYADQVLSCPAGRAVQLNRGAQSAAGDILLFLHADTLLPAGARQAILQALSAGAIGGAFRLTFAARPWRYRLLEAWSNLRSAAGLGICGDQAIFTGKQNYLRAGGFPEIPIFEDCEFIRNLQRTGPVALLPLQVVTSARRWQEFGFWRAGLAMFKARLAQLAHVEPHEIAKTYYQAFQSAPTATGQGQDAGTCGMTAAAICVFAKQPRPGQVKTRLAESVGAEQAAAIYQALLADVLHCAGQVNVQGLRHIIMVDQPSAVAWFEQRYGGAYAIRVQAGGDLGDRLHHTFNEQFSRGAKKVIVIGSDCVDITPQILHSALAALDKVPAVIGPAQDGGYYLIGLSRAADALFRDMPWSSSAVWQVTQRRLAARGMAYHVLPVLRDVDTVEDWRHAPARLSNETKLFFMEQV